VLTMGEGIIFCDFEQTSFMVGPLQLLNLAFVVCEKPFGKLI